MPGHVFEFRHETVEGCQQEYPSLWATAKSSFPYLADDQIALVVSLVVGTCPHCHEAPSTGTSLQNMMGCQCWNDE